MHLHNSYINNYMHGCMQLYVHIYIPVKKHQALYALNTLMRYLRMHTCIHGTYVYMDQLNCKPVPVKYVCIYMLNKNT